MDKMTCQMTVLFEGAFWVGIFEKTEGNRLSVAKVTFGAEPKDLEVRDFILKHFYELKFSPEVKTQVKERKQMLEKGIGTKSQQLLKLQHEQNKQERKERSHKKKETEEHIMFELKQQKKKERHKGH